MMEGEDSSLSFGVSVEVQVSCTHELQVLLEEVKGLVARSEDVLHRICDLSIQYGEDLLSLANLIDPEVIAIIHSTTTTPPQNKDDQFEGVESSSGVEDKEGSLSVPEEGLDDEEEEEEEEAALGQKKKGTKKGPQGKEDEDAKE